LLQEGESSICFERLMTENPVIFASIDQDNGKGGEQSPLFAFMHFRE
jgi:hypothetical protein